MGSPSEALSWSMDQVAGAVARGMATFSVPEPKTLDQWAREHFYLSAESSYVEQQWSPWPFQRAIMSCISNDDIVEVDLRKSARVGYTKMLLAALGYFTQHKRRNVAVFQPTDDDRDEFVKTELEPMLRDVEVMRSVFPAYLQRHKDNTLQQKKMLGCMMHMRGGKAAKNYRRISVDFVTLDEYSAFDPNIEKEGDPGGLAIKRIEGAIFPKALFGTTPKLKGFDNIEKRERMADLFMTFRVPCPSCGEHHSLTWGGKEEPHGMKWVGSDPETVRHLCPHCGTLITQGEFLAVADRGRYQADDGTTCDFDGVFRDRDEVVIKAPRHVAFHVWTAYSPMVAWSALVREFLAAHLEKSEGKGEKLQTFWNTTLGEYWTESYEKTEASELEQRAEPFPLERVPMGCVLLLAGIDTQPNRLEVSVWGYGRGCETWSIAHRIFFGNPDEDEIWADLDEFLFETNFPHAAGSNLKISGVAIDTGGHNTQAVYNWAAKHARKKVFAVKGRSGREKHIKDGASKVDLDWRGRSRKHGLVLWWVGTNLAKDLLYGRLQIQKPGPGYIHFSKELSDEWFKQYTGEARTTRRTQRGDESVWTPLRKRLEAKDCAVYAVWLETYFDLTRKAAKYWDDLYAKVQPAVADLFDSPAPAAVAKLGISEPPKALPQLPPPQSSGFARDEWLIR